MADISGHRADIKLAVRTLEAIERAVEQRADDGLRPHLGASLIGRPCRRQLWYLFRWAVRPAHSGRILRLFARGQREEEALAELLRAAGVTVITHNPNTGEQYRFGTGHFGGSMDGACVGLPDAPKTWHVLEFKTHNLKSFNQLEKEGVRLAKPEHWAQMQCYMHWSGMTRALYVAVCKDDDRLHLERIDYDRKEAEALLEKAQAVINAPEPPARISEDAAWYQCKWCDAWPVCHGKQLPLPTCRSCVHATPEPDGSWSCRYHKRTLMVEEQKRGCHDHVYIPHCFEKLAEPVECDPQRNVCVYEIYGRRIENGSDGISSAALYEHYRQEEADEAA